MCDWCRAMGDEWDCPTCGGFWFGDLNNGVEWVEENVCGPCRVRVAAWIVARHADWEPEDFDVSDREDEDWARAVLAGSGH